MAYVANANMMTNMDCVVVSRANTTALEETVLLFVPAGCRSHDPKALKKI